MMVEWIQVGTCSLKALEVVFLLMGHLAIMQLDMDMVLPVMVLVMVAIAAILELVLVMGDLQVRSMGILMFQILAMQAVLLGHPEVHGTVKVHLAMVLWVMGVLLLGVLQMLVLAVVLVQRLLVNLLVGPLGMGVKVMGMVVMVEMMDLM
jgi:hypothetical protein